MHCDITVELTESVEAKVRVHFTCASPGCPADRITPGEGPSFDILEVEVLALYGRDWEKSQDELIDQDFYDSVRVACEWAVDSYGELYEHQFDAYEAHMFEQLYCYETLENNPYL